MVPAPESGCPDPGDGGIGLPWSGGAAWLRRMGWRWILLYVWLGCSCGVREGWVRVDDKVWRSPQPSREGFQVLKEQGVGEVLNLRQWNSDEGMAAEGMLLHRVRMNAGDIRDEQVLESLRILQAADEPVIVHCWHGADRTGVVVAMYRMVVQGWSRERAIAELMEPEFGHHESIYPNIREYLETVDIGEMRRRLAGKS